MVTSHIHLGNEVKNGCRCTSSPTYIFRTYTWDDLIFTHHMNTLSFIILCWSVKRTGEWPPTPYAGLCVFTLKRLKYPHYARKSYVSKIYKWHFKPSTTRLLEVCQLNLKWPYTVKNIKAYFEANHSTEMSTQENPKLCPNF
jgi:hypothetical protein